MSIVSVRIPQIGEGLQEARLVAVLKQPGDNIRRDEPIYQMETDKAVMDVESPFEGVLVEWLGQPDDILEIGAEVARMEVAEVGAEAVAEPVAAETPAEPAPASMAGIPPRTRAYAREKGLSDDVLAVIVPAGSKLMPSDIDAHLAGSSVVGASLGYTEAPLSGKQRLLASRLVRGSQLVVPGTISVAVNWGPIEQMRARYKSSGAAFQPSAFTMLAFAVVQALKQYPSFRSSLIGDSTLRTYENVSLGIAVSLPGDELVLAVVDKSDTLTWEEFAAAARASIDKARAGQDQANESVTVNLTNMQSFGLRDAVAVVVPPGVATLFIGEVYNGLNPTSEELAIQRTCNLSLTFDHRLINGVGAANFLNEIKQRVETISSWIG